MPFVTAPAATAPHPVTAPLSPTLLDTLLPRYDHRTMQGRAVKAPLEAVVAAIRETPLDDAKLARTLLAVRTLGRSLHRRRARIADTGDGETGFVPVGAAPAEVVVGFAGRPWPGGATLHLDAVEWKQLEPVDCVKVGMSVRATTASYGTLLITETRIVCGPQAKEAFDRYWLIVRPGSDLVRGSLLRAIARHAERAA
ncbi:MAG: hypothetical protein QOJ07_1504 [Thermoleophilaceae bacterium]|jgi:hypothetical protein|nr:hypothetical protein [Thermoleophilaceae bacterium]